MFAFFSESKFVCRGGFSAVLRVFSGATSTRWNDFGRSKPVSAQVHFQACPWALPLAFLSSFFDCSQRFRSRGQVFLVFRLLRELRRRGTGQGRCLCSDYFGGYIDEGMGRQASLMFRRLRRLHRRGLGQTGVAYVLATSGATSTRAWAGVSLVYWLLHGLHRRGHGQAGVAYVPVTSGATSTMAWTGRRCFQRNLVGGFRWRNAVRDAVKQSKSLGFRRVACTAQPYKIGQSAALSGGAPEERLTRTLPCMDAKAMAFFIPYVFFIAKQKKSASRSYKEVVVHGHESRGSLYTLCLVRF